MPVEVEYPPLSPMATGLGCKCPRCGIGSLFDGLLNVAARCSHCDLDLSAHDSGDGPAVFVIFALGFIIVPLALAFEVWVEPPIWVHLLIWIPVILATAVLLLRPFKAILVGYHFRNLRHTYSE